MAIAAPILCVAATEEESEQFRTALDRLGVRNPVRHVVASPGGFDTLERKIGDETRPVLVLLSLNAAEANRVAAWFETHPQHRPAGLIATTGFGDMRPVLQAYHLGVTAFLSWPVTNQDLRNALAANSEIAVDEVEGGIVVKVAPCRA